MPIDRETAPNPPPTLARWIALAKASAAGVVAGLVFWVLAEAGSILVGSNFHEVAPGIYRIAQPTRSQLTYYIHRNGIKTVINLRGCCDPSPWYLDEADVCS